MTPIERAAKAYFDGRAKRVGPGTFPMWGELSEYERQAALLDFRAALLALATPEAISDEMVEAAMRSYFAGAFAPGDITGPVGDAFRTAIAASIRVAAGEKT